jgi:CheY-like chemotaxis protein
MTKILLVEDDKSLREIYGVRLLAEGYDIVSAGDGEEALAMAIKEKPSLIISDVMMPKISGFDMLDILRSTTETRDIKVIMMTALSSEDQRARGEQLGADRYLVKSQVGIEDVVRTVHEVIGDAPSGDTPAAAPAASPNPAPTAAPAASTATSGANAAPGNDAAGPLPPQPTESTLPQPTAPFSSPRPTNLGERVIQPVDDTVEAGISEEVSNQINQELQASADPINTQVDELPREGDAAAVPAPSTPPVNEDPIAPTIAPLTNAQLPDMPDDDTSDPATDEPDTTDGKPPTITGVSTPAS